MPEKKSGGANLALSTVIVVVILLLLFGLPLVIAI